MKKRQLLIAVMSGALLLSGCTQTKNENGKDVLATINGENIFADDVYTSLSSSTMGKTALFSYILDELIKENFPINDDMKENADELIENIKMNFKNQYGNDSDKYLNEQLAAGGYKDLDAYKESLIQSLQYSEFIKKYVKEHFDEIYDDYYKVSTPRLMSIIKISAQDVEKLTPQEKENLEEVKKLLNSNKSFGDIASSYSTHESKNASGSIGIIDQSNTTNLTSIYGENFVKEAFKLKENETSAQIKGTDGYYFLHCDSTSKDKIKNELKTVDISSPLLTYDEYIVYYAFKTYSLDFKDKNTQKIINDVIDEALANRQKERGKK